MKTLPAALSYLGFLIIFVGAGFSSCVMTNFQRGCPELHLWWYLPLGVFVAGVGMLVVELVRPNNLALAHSMVCVGLITALLARYFAPPFVHHGWYEYPRFPVGVAFLLITLAPVSGRFTRLIPTIASLGIIINHLE